MNKIFKIITFLYLLTLFSLNFALSKENFFNEALKMYQIKNMTMHVLF